MKIVRGKYRKRTCRNCAEEFGSYGGIEAVDWHCDECAGMMDALKTEFLHPSREEVQDELRARGIDIKPALKRVLAAARKAGLVRD